MERTDQGLQRSHVFREKGYRRGTTFGRHAKPFTIEEMRAIVDEAPASHHKSGFSHATALTGVHNRSKPAWTRFEPENTSP